MSQPATFSETIPYLNASIQRGAGQLLDALINLFNQHPDFAAAIIPAYAKYLNSQDFETLSHLFPALSPLLNGYRQIIESKIA